jgi:hypothetical protein
VYDFLPNQNHKPQQDQKSLTVVRSSVGWVAAFGNPTSAINHLNSAMLIQCLQSKTTDS